VLRLEANGDAVAVDAVVMLVVALHRGEEVVAT